MWSRSTAGCGTSSWSWRSSRPWRRPRRWPTFGRRITTDNARTVRWAISHRPSTRRRVRGTYTLMNIHKIFHIVNKCSDGFPLWLDQKMGSRPFGTNSSDPFVFFRAQISFDRTKQRIGTLHVAGRSCADDTGMTALRDEREQVIERCHAINAARRQLQAVGNVIEDVVPEVAKQLLGRVQDLDQRVRCVAVALHARVQYLEAVVAAVMLLRRAILRATSIVRLNGIHTSGPPVDMGGTRRRLVRRSHLGWRRSVDLTTKGQ